ncbi:MAG: hypothetical protein R3F02_05605 [Thiolinea sp.]
MSIVSFCRAKTYKSIDFYERLSTTIRAKKSQHHTGTGQKTYKDGLRPYQALLHNISFNFRSNTKTSVFFELSKSQHPAHTENYKLTRDPYSLRGGKNRPQHGDFFSSVSCTSAVFPGVHRIQQAQAEYMHRFHEAIRTPGHLYQSLENVEYTPMQTALNTGELRPKTAQQMRPPAFPVPSDSDFAFPDSDLDYTTTPNGVLVTSAGLMVAWIYQGHAGSRTNPRRCQFFDVAHPSLTTDDQNRLTGMMLDSASFDTLSAAVAFVQSTFATEETAE